MHKFTLSACLALLVVFTSCRNETLQDFSADDPNIRYAGRVDLSNEKEPILISSASYVEFKFEGDHCMALLKKLNPPGENNYISVELDGADKGRFKVISDTLSSFLIEADSFGIHRVKIFKSTEAANNQIVFGGVKCLALKPLEELPPRKIEFIGNSITCGMGNDLSGLPCDSGTWFDQHNAYWAYGPIAARELDARFLLSSVSGIGMYRNWNSLSPVMPDVYENLYLDTDSSKKYDFSSYTPDLVSICLGTNDLSLGDGVNKRLPFDSAVFTGAYIDFVEIVYTKYSDVRVSLLTSPMVKEETGQLLRRCLLAVQSAINAEYPGRKRIEIFVFPEGIVPHGCDYHPDIEDHKQMAELLVPFYKELMGW